jgi:hypothetical protein
MRRKAASRKNGLGQLTLLLYGLVAIALVVLGCDESTDTEPQADAGDTDVDGGGDDNPSTCVTCHSQEEALIASLEADPLPEEEEEEEESTGEG